jgi:hypothetical protein
MTTTIHVSRTFHVDPVKNPQVLDELRLLAARGFEVLGPLDLTPVADVESSVLASQRRRRERFAEVIAELRDAHGLKVVEVARLIGATEWAVYSWLKAESAIARQVRAPKESSIKEAESLLARARKLPKGSTVLRDEARGVRTELKRRGRRPLLLDDQKLAIGVMAEAGSSLRVIAKAFSVSVATVSRVIAELGGRKP